MIKQNLYFISFISIFLFFPFAAIGQSPALELDEPLPVPTDETADIVLEEELDDSDLTADLAAESLPTQNRFSYRWELMRNGVSRFFSLKAEKKAELYQRHLHVLDRKLAACAEIGDAKCTQLIEQRITKLTTRANNYMERRQELRDKLQDKFQAWRERREAMMAERQQRVAELKNKRQELITARQETRQEARTNRATRREEIKINVQERREQVKQNIEQRQENRQQLRENVQEERQLNLEQRRQNQEKLIELRSQNVKDRLDDTRAKVEARQEASAALNAE